MKKSISVKNKHNMAEFKHLTGPGNYLAVFIRHSSPPELTNKDYHSAQAVLKIVELIG